MRTLFVALTIVGIASPGYSQTITDCSMSGIRTGWNADSFAIETVEPLANPANCPTPDGYISEKSQPGYNTYYNAALAAYLGPTPKIVTTVDNNKCIAGRPKLIGINLKK